MWSKLIWKKRVCWLNWSGLKKTKAISKLLCTANTQQQRIVRCLFLQVTVLICYMVTHWISGGFGNCKGGRVQFLSKPIEQWAQTKWPRPTLGRSIWERLTLGFNECNDQSRDHLCCGKADQEGNCTQHNVGKGSWLNRNKSWLYRCIHTRESKDTIYENMLIYVLNVLYVCVLLNKRTK